VNFDNRHTLSWESLRRRVALLPPPRLAMIGGCSATRSPAARVGVRWPSWPNARIESEDGNRTSVVSSGTRMASADLNRHRMLLRQAEGATMPAKTPQKPSTKKVGKSLKEKRAAKKQKRDDKRIIPGS
jgi:hypothetical protein